MFSAILRSFSNTRGSCNTRVLSNTSGSRNTRISSYTRNHNITRCLKQYKKFQYYNKSINNSPCCKTKGPNNTGSPNNAHNPSNTRSYSNTAILSYTWSPKNTRFPCNTRTSIILGDPIILEVPLYWESQNFLCPCKFWNFDNVTVIIKVQIFKGVTINIRDHSNDKGPSNTSVPIILVLGFTNMRETQQYYMALYFLKALWYMGTL